MLAYHNNPDLKTKALAIMGRHRAAETLVQNRGYWINGKGCAVGCLLHDLGVQPNNHSAYEDLLGIPEPLARLEDNIFEALPVADSQAWPETFLGAIRPGADLSLVTWQFLDWLLGDLPEVDDADVTEAVARVRREVTGPAARGEKVDKEVVEKAADAASDARDAALTAGAARAARAAALTARAVARAADDAADDAALAVVFAACAVDAALTARAAALTARAVARAADDAADDAARAVVFAACAVDAACASEDVARAATAARQRQANQLIKLLDAA